LQRRLNCALQGGLPKVLRKKPQRLAVDLTLLPYYGQPQDDEGELYKGQFKAGTRRFHAYATAYVVCKGCRYTLGLLSVHHSDPWDETVKELLRQVRRAGVKIGLVLLDRGFYSVAVIRYLQAARYPFLMPVIRRGRKADDSRGPGGTRVFFQRKRSGWGEYTLQERGSKRKATVAICVCCRMRQPVRRPKAAKRRQVWVYAYWGVKPGSVSWVVETYRQRFGIESSYRQLNQGRIRTSTRSPLLRLLYVGLALILRNVYVWLHWEVLAYKRRGYRVVDLCQLPLKAMLQWLEKVVEDLLGLRTERETQRPLLV
jgi:Transposase DDE domain